MIANPRSQPTGTIKPTKDDLIIELAPESKTVTETLGEETIGTETNNSRIIRILGILGEVTDDHFRKRALKGAVEAVKSLDFEITNPSQLKGYKGIGKGIYTRIVEICQTGTLQEYEQQKEELNALKELSQVHGIGPKKAQELYHQYGIKNLEELNKQSQLGLVKLTTTQISGLRHLTDIKLPIPRAEIDLFDQWIKTLLGTVDPQANHLITGSYARGKCYSGDIDVLISHPLLVTRAQTRSSRLLATVMEAMRREGSLDSLLSQGENKVMLIAHLPQRYLDGSKPVSRRVDLLLTPIESYPAASLYFIGSRFFNQICRYQAGKLGYKLNEFGLYHREDEIPVPVKSQQEILEIIGVKWLEPEEREEVKLKGRRDLLIIPKTNR